jgi:hypothetical protein
VKTQSARFVVAAIAAVALGCFTSAAQDQSGKFGPIGPGPATQRKGIAPEGPAPKMPDGKPDLAGVWTPTNFMLMGGQPSLQPWADALYKERRANLSKDDPEGRCLPAGVPRISPFPMKLVQTPTLVLMLDEGNIHSYRQFFLDGRGHPKDLNPLWMGDSVAKWEGDALVVDTVSFNDRTWLNGQGLPHSDQLHVTERYQRPDLGHLSVDITMDDPKAFTKPHTFNRTYALLTDWEIHEYVCNEFNVDAEHLVGK